ncbi:hypothetical protein ACIF70_41735 [Actinacidiphila glaucinigra]|uniref:hypothetical protein n=1 Tax=Actinacidiphila glaucinigra TaxID=235986 RepID=UPI0037C5E579
MGQSEKKTRRNLEQGPVEDDTREPGTACADEDERDSEQQLKVPPHEKRRGTGLADF